MDPARVVARQRFSTRNWFSSRNLHLSVQSVPEITGSPSLAEIRMNTFQGCTGYPAFFLYPVSRRKSSSSIDKIVDIVISGLFGSPGSGSFIHKKTPCYSNVIVIKLSKIQFRLNNVLSLILSVIGSLAETPESAGMLKYFAQICLQIFTSFLQIYDVPRT